ncbi:MAG: hypothetical protein AAGA56_04075 [Myxococcota bacterium]
MGLGCQNDVVVTDPRANDDPSPSETADPDDMLAERCDGHVVPERLDFGPKRFFERDNDGCEADFQRWFRQAQERYGLPPPELRVCRLEPTPDTCPGSSCAWDLRFSPDPEYVTSVWDGEACVCPDVWRRCCPGSLLACATDPLTDEPLYMRCGDDGEWTRCPAASSGSGGAGGH